MASIINASTTSTSGLVYSADASGVLQLQSNGVTGLTVGTGGNVTVNTNLFVSGAEVEPLVLGTAQTATGTSVDFTGIPSWVKRVTLILSGVSLSGTSGMLVRFSVGGTFLTTGYTSYVDTMGTGVAPNAQTAGFGLGDVAPIASEFFYCTYTFINITGNTWVGTISGGSSNPSVMTGGGAIALAGKLDGIRLTTINGTNTFDAGTVNIMYE